MARRSQTRPNTTSSTPLYASQSTIPHLPVPTLSSTFHKYLETLQPLSTPDQLQRSTKLIQSFLASDFSKTLQTRLERRAKERDSWLSEWWNDAAYMGYRGRLIPNVNYFYVHKRKGDGMSQEDRAASLIRGVIEFKKLVDSERLEPERVKGQPLCMASYKYLFNATRIPASPADSPEAFPPNDHIIVLRKDRFFKVDAKGRGATDLAKAFKQVKSMADRDGPGVGILTSEDRDVFVEAHNHLLSISPANKSAIETLESSVLFVCLDDGLAPADNDTRSWSLWSGGTSRSPQGQGRNRWFDKHQVVVDEAGQSGFNGEHSMLDGTPTLRMNEFILAGLESGVIPLELPEGEQNSSSMPQPEEVSFDLDEKMMGYIDNAKKGFGDEMAQQDVKLVQFSGYGKTVIKKHRTSPDAWAQATKQLAFTRLFGRPAVTYESCQTRKFLLGRTEVIRACSAETKAFCDAMTDKSASDATRKKLLQAAATRHIQYSAWAADGQGVDRHMFGLRKLVKEGEEMPEVFKDEMFGKSGHWELSTSQLSSKYLEGWGYGEVVEDGYGLSYWIHDDSIGWLITTKNNNAAQFGKALCDAAEEVRAMMDRAAKAEGVEAPKAKL